MINNTDISAEYFWKASQQKETSEVIHQTKWFSFVIYGIFISFWIKW